MRIKFEADVSTEQMTEILSIVTGAPKVVENVGQDAPASVTPPPPPPPAEPPAAPPPPPAEPPAAPAAAPAAPPPAQDLDAAGLPWDERIHSMGRTKYKTTNGEKKAGCWTWKKQVDPALRTAVEAELRAGAKFPDVPPAAPAAPAEPPAAPAPAVTFADLMQHIVKNNVDMNFVNNMCLAVDSTLEFGRLGLPENAHFVPAVAAKVGM